MNFTRAIRSFAELLGVVSPAQGGLPTGGSTGQSLVKNSGTSYDTGWSTPAASGVTSVGLSLPSSVITVSGSPVTAAGTLTGTLAVQVANTAWMGPASGSSAAPTFRALVSGDIPDLSASYATHAYVATAIATVTPASLGLTIGTNVEAWSANLDTLAGLSHTKGQLIVDTGSAWTVLAPGTNTDVLTLDSTQSAGVKWAAPSGGGGGGGSPGGSVGDLQWNNTTFAGGGPTWDGSNILAITTSAAELRIAQDSTHFARLTRTATNNLAKFANKVNTPAGTGYALQFVSASSQSVTLAQAPTTASGSISCTFWVNLASTSLKGKFVKVGNEMGGWSIGVGTTDSATPGNDLVGGFEGSAWIPTGTPIGTGWHHIAMTIDSSGLPTYYLDGVSLGAFVVGTLVTPTNTASIGGSVASYYTDSIIDDVRFFASELSGSDVTAIYNGGVQAEVAHGSPVGWYKLDEGTGSTTADSGSNNYAGELNNSPTWVGNPIGVGTLAEVTGITIKDGVVAGESSIVTVGDPAGRVVVAFGTTLHWVLPGGDHTISDDLGNVTFPGTVAGSNLSGTNTGDQTPFVASGSSHAAGIVPDPGASAGSTHFLREDATWAVPAGGITGSGTTGDLAKWSSGTAIGNATAGTDFVAPGGVGSLTVGQAVSGGVTTALLREDGSGNLLANANLTYDETTGNLTAKISGTTFFQILDGRQFQLGTSSRNSLAWIEFVCNTADVTVGCVQATNQGINQSAAGDMFMGPGTGKRVMVGDAAVTGYPWLSIAAGEVAFWAHSSTTDRQVAYLDAGFTDPTDASYVGFGRLCAQDWNATSGGVEGVHVTTDGAANPLVGLFGVTPVAQPVLSYSRSGALETAAVAAIRVAGAAVGLWKDSTTT